MTHKTLYPTDIITVLITLGETSPQLMLLHHDQNSPSLEGNHYSLQRSLRHWVETLTGCSIGYMEQLYTFAEPQKGGSSTTTPHIHITYLALTNHLPLSCHSHLYRHFPWEDRRSKSGNQQLENFIARIRLWADERTERQSRIATAFGLDGLPWDDTRVLERYELLWESGLVPRIPNEHVDANTPNLRDERRLLATALARLRMRIRYSSAIFDLLPPSFTLLHLQQAMETLSGRFMHKPNFRRLVLHQKLVEETGRQDNSAPGRPAKLYRFCPSAAASCYLGAAFLPLE